ncbi:BA14K family protein [Salinarimonas sp.]|uniref:BA14K family protein n=1 Tax=Salinarimonas sp. TaxID=2766526 RepID=UPI00391CD09E
MHARVLGLGIGLLAAAGAAAPLQAQGVYFSENEAIHHRDVDPVYQNSPDAVPAWRHRYGYDHGYDYGVRYGYAPGYEWVGPHERVVGYPVVVERRVRRHPYPRDFYPPYAYDPGAAIAAGIVGLAAGAVLGQVLTAPAVPVAPRARVAYGPAEIAYCARKYRSFDRATLTFLGYDGRRHLCRIP